MRSLRLRPPQPDQRHGEVPGAHKGPGPLRVLRRPRTPAGCVFCALEGSGRELLENELALCIADAYPVSERQAMSFQSCAPRAMDSCQVQR